MNSVENLYKKKNDPYEEKWYIIHEKAECYADDKLEVNDKLQKEGLKEKGRIKPLRP